jgi:hypothetical protein
MFYKMKKNKEGESHEIGVYTKKSLISTHLHFLIKVYGLHLLGSDF